MGTDIHLYVEQRQADGSWKVLPPPERDLTRWPKTPQLEDGWVSRAVREAYAIVSAGESNMLDATARAMLTAMTGGRK